MPDLSPLSESERATSIALADAQKQAKGLVPERSRAVLVQPIVPDRQQPEDARHVVVGLYDYEQNRSVVAVVDVKAQTVVGLEDTNVQFQLDAQERREAEELAGRDDRVIEFLHGRPMNPLTRLYFPPEGSGSDPTHRYAIVFVRPNHSERCYAVVDLSQREVHDVFELDRVRSE
jgi:hypothetical protein